MYEKLDLSGIRDLRGQIQNMVDLIDGQGRENGSRELSIVKTKLEEAKMWLGKQMGSIGGEDLNAKRDKELAN